MRESTHSPPSAPAGPAHQVLGSVWVVIVNYRTGRLVADCLASLRAEVAARPGTQVVVVDNASGDDSCSLIDAAIQALRASGWARLVRSDRNAGFAAGNNLAIREALSAAQAPDAFWLLNPDTRVEAGALQALVDALQADPACGMAGSQLLEADGQPWPFAFRFPSMAGELEACARLRLVSRFLGHRALAREMDCRPGAPRVAVDWVSGASFIVRRSVFEQVGLMDEGYFLYYEETDFARRAADAGWASVFAPASRVLHISGQSTGVTGQQDQPRRMPAYWFESRRRYFEKHHGRAYALGADLACIAGTLLWHLARLIRRRPDTNPPRFLADLIRHGLRRLPTGGPATG